MAQMTVQDAFQTAVQHHQAGRLAEAEGLYRQILQVAPDHFDATQLLGLVLYQTARYADAIALLRKALATDPAAWGPRCNLALALLETGQLAEAMREADAALAINPTAKDALFARAAVLVKSRRHTDAIPLWRQLLSLHPDYAVAWASFGATLEMLGQLEEALEACQRAVELEPGLADAHVNLGSVLAKLGRPEQGIAHQRLAIQLAPDLQSAHLNLSLVASQLHRFDEAEAAARRAIALDPDDPDPFRNLATIVLERGALEEAEQALQTAANLLQGHGTTHDRNTANLLRLAAALLLPVVYDSAQQMTQWRERMIDRLAVLKREEILISVDEEPAPMAFELAYHGQNDREIHQAIGELIVASPSTGAVPTNSGKCRLAFISRFFREHTIGRLNAGLIAELSRDDFEVTVFKVGEANEPLTDFLRARAHRFIVLPPILRPAREMIAAQQLDVLFYTDIGMDPLTSTLAHSRLAPVQCMTWGHPVTSGIKTIDYFISSSALEVPGSETQYTEQLVRLATPAVYYYRPTLPAQAKMRPDFGLPEEATLYGCMQMLWKLQPQFDALLAAVLRRDPRGILLLLEGTSSYLTEKLKTRLARTMPDVVDRVRVMPAQPYPDFLTLTSLCDVMLDPIHFGGGNTSYEALAFGVPVITWPSHMLRGRITFSLYQLMGITDCVAQTHEQYVDLAVAIATNSERRRIISGKIFAAHYLLFENPSGVRELETFLKETVAVRGRF